MYDELYNFDPFTTPQIADMVMVPTASDVHLETEEHLWYQVLIYALRDLAKHKRKAKARFWFNSPHKTVGSFLWVCKIIGLQAEEIRDTINSRMKRKLLLTALHRTKHTL